MDNNSTVMTFAGLANLDRSSISIQTQPTPRSTVRRAELVKFQALVNEGPALVSSEDALGNDMYDIDNFLMDILHGSPSSDFHLGQRTRRNPIFADDEFEDPAQME